MNKEGSVRNFLGQKAITVGSSFSLDSRAGRELTMYYNFDGKKPLEEIVFDNENSFISDREVIFQTEPSVFLLHNQFPLTLPGNRIEVEKLYSTCKENTNTIRMAHITPGLKKTQIEQINALDEITRYNLVTDLAKFYPQFTITNGYAFEGSVGEYGGLLDSPSFEQVSAVEGFAKPQREEVGDRSIWKIAKEYPQKKEYERIILSFGLDYSIPENTVEVINKRSDEFVKAMELRGQDAITMIDQIARPSIEIRRQSFYDTDTSLDR